MMRIFRRTLQVLQSRVPSCDRKPPWAQEQKKLSAFGAFDGWIAVTKPPSSQSGVDATKDQVTLPEFHLGLRLQDTRP